VSSFVDSFIDDRRRTANHGLLRAHALAARLPFFPFLELILRPPQERPPPPSAGSHPAPDSSTQHHPSVSLPFIHRLSLPPSPSASPARLSNPYKAVLSQHSFCSTALCMSTNRSIRKSLPYLNAGSPSDSMFYNYSPTLSLTQHQASTRSPLAEEKEVRSPDFVWEAEYQDKMTVLEKSIAQVPSSEKRQINFQFIDDMKATFDFNTLHSKRKRPTDKQITADNKSSARKDRKAAVKLPDLTKKRRPRNAFILYRTVLQAKAEFKGKTQTELSRLIAACWQNEPPETRARFERAAELEKSTPPIILPLRVMC